jgi:DNA-binding transcriptional MocR family regulator
LNTYFPKTVKMTSPSGGLAVWVELPPGINGRQIYLEAKKNGISILPGFLCSSLDIYDHFIRIGYGGRWDNDKDRAIGKMGEIIRNTQEKN